MVWEGVLSKGKGLLEVWAHLNPWPLSQRLPYTKKITRYVDYASLNDKNLMVSSKWNQQVITFTGSRIDGFHLDVSAWETWKNHQVWWILLQPKVIQDTRRKWGPFSTTAGQLTDICSYPVVDKKPVLGGHIWAWAVLGIRTFMLLTWHFQ